MEGLWSYSQRGLNLNEDEVTGECWREKNKRGKQAKTDREEVKE